MKLGGKEVVATTQHQAECARTTTQVDREMRRSSMRYNVSYSMDPGPMRQAEFKSTFA